MTIILSSAVGIEVGYSSDKEELCDKDYEGALMSEDTTAVYSDWINEMRRINKQKTAVMLYVNRMNMLRVQAAEE